MKFIKNLYKKIIEISSLPQVYFNEIYLRFIPNESNLKARLLPLKIAFAKQFPFQGFYCAEKDASPKILLETCFKHSGPLGLATKMGAHFPILKITNHPETQIWKETIVECGHGRIEDFLQLEHTPFLNGARGHTTAPGQFAIDPSAIDWSKYDIVLSAGVSIPTEVVVKYPETTWAFLVDHPVTTHYRLAQKKALYGYNIFLNIRYRTLRIFPRPNKAHAIDWPFDILPYGVFHEALEVPLDDSSKRKGVFLESHSAQILTSSQRRRLENIGEIFEVSPKTSDIIKSLMKSKYYVRCGGRLLWGNAQIEGIAAGTLFVGNPREFINKSLFTKKTSIRTFDELIERLVFFENNPIAYKIELEKQRKLLNYICFYRPLLELQKKHLEIQSSRKNLQNKILK
jgi:hypothetical protein